MTHKQLEAVVRNHEKWLIDLNAKVSRVYVKSDAANVKTVSVESEIKKTEAKLKKLKAYKKKGVKQIIC